MPTPNDPIPAPPIQGRGLVVAQAEILEILRDLNFALLSPLSESRNARLAGCVAGLERSIERIRRAMNDPVPHVYTASQKEMEDKPPT